MSTWFKQAAVAGVAALSLALFSGGQLAAAAPTPSPSPSETSATPTSPATSASPQEEKAPSSEAPAPAETPTSEAPESDAPESEAPTSEAPESETPAPETSAPSSPSSSVSSPSEPAKKKAAKPTAADFLLSISGGACVPFGSETAPYTFSLTNTGTDGATATISVAGPVNFSLGTHTVGGGGSAGEIGSEDLAPGEYTVTFDFAEGEDGTETFTIEACESPITFASVDTTCATANDGAITGAIANAQDTAVTVGVRVVGADGGIAVEVPANGEANFALNGLAPGDHEIEVIGSVDGQNVTADSATATVESCISIVEVKQFTCASDVAAGVIDWTLRNDSDEDVTVRAAIGDRELLPTFLPAGEEGGMAAPNMQPGEYTITFTAEADSETRVIGTRTVTVEECPVVDVAAELERVDCFNGNASFDNSGSNIPVTFRVWDGDTKVAEVEVAAGESGDASYKFTGRTLKVTAQGGDVSREVLTADYTEACAALAKPIKVSAECNQVTFTSPAGNGAVTVQYGDMNQTNVDGEFTLAGGASKTVDTSRTTIDWAAITDVNGDTVVLQIQRGLAVEDCAAPSPSPSPSTEAPQPPAEAPDAPELAETGSSSSLTSILLGAGLLVAGAGALVLGRRRR
ncbi:LPXTG cell wall anchor domain-containing protein [Propionibacteriaceae bacterium Y1700]|uniref:LPXTG cell wall anchor domain-containing protein n=1 Tax=Microlunatus sp. Y1700 TaxID=3418487 RepID=UPI003DA6EEEC